MTRRLPLLIGYSLLFLIVFSMFRILFIFKYSYRMENFLLLDVIHGLVIGLRFDLATLGMILGGFWILSSIHFLNRFQYLLYYGLTSRSYYLFGSLVIWWGI